jgi:nitrogen fixation protein NifX
MRRLRLIDHDTASGSGEAVRSPGGAMKIAIATQDLKTLDAHFAAARNLAVYEVTADGHRLVEAIRFETASGEDGMHADAHDDRITPRIAAIEGCALLFVLAIGGPAAAQVVKRRIHPIKLQHPEPIAHVIARVQAMLKGTPPPWLRKAMAANGRERPAFVDDGAAAKA